MSSSSSYGACPQPHKAVYAPRPPTSAVCRLPVASTAAPKDPPDNLAAALSNASSSLSAQSGSSSRGPRYSKPPIIHNGGGQTHDPNTSTSAPNGGYHS